MPMNTTQRKTLREVLRYSVDTLIEQRQSAWLSKVIAPVNLSLTDAIAILRRHPDLVSNAFEAVNVPVEARQALRQLDNALHQPQATLAQETLKKLEQYPNYNPYNIAAMQQFEEQVASAEECRPALIALRELYLEMTPLAENSYGHNYQSYRYRIGEVPLNLNNYGPALLAGEISEEVVDYVLERLELEQAKQAELDKMAERFKQLELESKDREYAMQLQLADHEDRLKAYKQPISNNPNTLFNQPASRSMGSEPQDAQAQYEIGLGFYRAKDYQQASIWLQKAADQGHAKAQYKLGKCYHQEYIIDEKVLASIGEYNKLDYVPGADYEGFYVASDWYHKAAEQGHVKAQYQLGNWYGNSSYGDWPSEAVKWYRRAAEQGHKEAQYMLGYYYDDGKDVVKDLAEAVKWYRKAAEQGHERAKYSLGLCYYNGEGVTQDFTEAAEWFKKVAEQGHNDEDDDDSQYIHHAQYLLGDCYYNGKGVVKDLIEAVKWYRKAAEEGYAEAGYRLGNCYYYGKGVNKDFTEAVKWYRRESDTYFAHAEAQFMLGCCYYFGTGINKDVTEAAKWFRKAADQGVAKAQYNVGIFYYNGEGGTKDLNEAMKWLNKAAEQGNANAKEFLQKLGASTQQTQLRY